MMNELVGAEYGRPGAGRLAWVVLLVLAPVLTLWLVLSPLAGAEMPAGKGAIITVTTTDDELNSDGDCALREAIHAANTDSAVDACPAGSGADTVMVPAGIYTLTIPGAGEDGNLTGDLDILEDLTLQGAGAVSTTIDGGALDRVIHVLFTDAIIEDLTVANGFSPEEAGGGIRNENAYLTIRQAAVVSSTAGSGGGLANLANKGFAAWLVVEDVAVRGNAATSSYGGDGWGGGIGNGAVDDGSMAILTLTGSLVAENEAGGVASAAGVGGGIANAPGYCSTCSAIVTILESTIRDNAAVYGGGLANTRWQTTGTPPARLTLEKSTVSDNVAASDLADAGIGGGILAGGGTTEVYYSTISGNRATSTGKGIAGQGGGLLALSNFGTVARVTISNTTVAHNLASAAGGGLATANLGTQPDPAIGIAGAVVAGNSAPIGLQCHDPYGANQSVDYNLEDGDSCNFDQPGDLVNTDPLLGPLRDNGGPTWTHLPHGISPAIDRIPAGVNGCGTTVTTDQRGSPCPRDGDGDAAALCDAGSVELHDPVALNWTFLPLAGRP